MGPAVPFLYIGGRLVALGSVQGGQDLHLDLGSAPKALTVKRDGTLLDSQDQRDGVAIAGSSIITWSHGLTTPMLQTNYTLIDGEAFVVMVHVAQAVTATGAMFLLTVNGNYTANNYNGVGLYSAFDGSFYNLLASSTNDGNLWKPGGVQMVQKPFSAPIDLTPGIYHLAFMYCRSAEVTPPRIAACPNTISVGVSNLDFASSIKTYQATGLGALTAFQSLFTTYTSDVRRPFVALY